MIKQYIFSRTLADSQTLAAERIGVHALRVDDAKRKAEKLLLPGERLIAIEKISTGALPMNPQEGLVSDENHLDRHLKTYTEIGRKDKGNGVSHVQRICRIGYNQARRMVDRGIETGVLTNDPEKDYLHRIAPTMSEDRTYKGSGREFGEPE